MVLPEPVSEMAARTLRVVLDRRGSTRPEVSAALAVTKQTISAAMLELESRGLLTPVAVQQGATGRSAVRYGLSPSAGWVAGVDLGSSRLRIVAIRLDGTVIGDRFVANRAATIDRAWPDRLSVAGSALADLAHQLAESSGGLLGVGLAVPRSVSFPRDLVGTDLDESDPELLEAMAPISPAAAFEENHVNCEALAQLRSPVTAPANVLHLHVGLGVGAAFIAERRLVRGQHGRAGEIGSLPSPLPGRPGTVESALGVTGLLAAAGHSVGARLSGAIDDLFSAAALGDAAADSAIADEATGLVMLLDRLAQVLDPDRIVLSGQLGGRADMLERVQGELERARLDLEVAVDPLGDASAVLGAATLAADQVLAALLGRAPAC